MNSDHMVEILQKELTDYKGPMEIFARAFYNNPLIMSVSEMESGRIIAVNQAFCLFFGFSPEEVRGRTSLELNLWANPQERRLMIEKSGMLERIADWEVEMQTRCGKRSKGLLRFESLEWNGCWMILSIVNDVAPIPPDENNVGESARFLEAMVLRFPLPMLLHADRRISVINVPAVRLLRGVAASQFLGQPILNFIHPDYQELARERIDSIYYQRKEAAFIEEKFICHDGTEIEVEVGANAIDYMGKPASLVVFKDITERKLLEAETFKAQKLESVGLLAGGIAHDFNNILTAVVGNISLAKLETSASGRLSQLLEQAEKAAMNAQGLTRQLLTFARGGEPVKESSSVEDLIRDSSDFVLRGSRCICQYSFHEGLWPVEIDRGQISQVIQNIVINAAQSMPQGGVIHISASNLVLESDQVLSLPLGPFIRIVVRDQGVGIAPDSLHKVFDPYFSTKKTGSGLGLAVVYSIIKKHNGAVTVSSTPGEGSEFVIYLPAKTDAVATSVPAEEKNIIMGRGRVLIMDDNPSVLESLRAMTEALGYVSFGASHGNEAIDLYKNMYEKRRPFDAVIMDLTIPGAVGGQEAVRKVLAFDPGARVIVTSGYSNDPVLADYKRFGFSGVLTKPVLLSELSRVLHSLIHKPAY